MSTSRSRTGWRALPAVAFWFLLPSLLLAGCVSIPASGPVVPGRAMDDVAREPRRSFELPGPAPGDSPTAIVYGFLRAAPDYSRDHSTARSFLTKDQRTTWRPDSPVVVHDAELTRLPMDVTQVGANPLGAPAEGFEDVELESGASPSQVTVAVRIPVAATVDADGVYLAAPAEEVRLLTFHLVGENGQWRIANPPNGIVLSKSEFRSTFTDVPLYFRESTGRYLTPDIRWFPVTAAPSVVVSALLRGPVNWLAPAVTSGAPSGTELSGSGVRIEGRTLLVDLSTRAKEGSPEQRQVLVTQLRTTLREASRRMDFGADAVQVTVQQANLTVEGNEQPPRIYVNDPEADRRPVVLDAEHRINRLSATTPTPVEGLPALSAQAMHPAVSPIGDRYAYLGAGGTRLVTVEPGGEPQTRVEAGPLTPPSFDVRNWLWTAPTDNTGSVYAVPVTGAAASGSRAITVAAPWLSGHRVLSLRISPEGARALVVASHGRRAKVYVSGIARDADGAPTVLTDPWAVIDDLTTAQDGTWMGTERVAVVGDRRVRQGPRVWVARVGGEISEGIAAPDVRSITVQERPHALWAQTGRGAAYQSGAGLLPLADGLRWPAAPG